MCDLICFSHLRWNFVYQRPQHLMVRFSKQGRVFFIEEPVFDGQCDFNEVYKDKFSDVYVVVPHMSREKDDIISRQRILLNTLFVSEDIESFIVWYYSPMALEFSDHLNPELTIYDCMDELSAFKFAPSSLKSLEQQLFQKADVVFTGGYSLFESKKNRHQNIFPFPSSIDKSHFYKARLNKIDPEDQYAIPHPRLGFYGVIDERFDIALIENSATLKPDWQFVIIGPIVKIEASTLPRNKNIHYLGSKSYLELPGYLSGWDICLIPFVLDQSTRFISPTKTPEYLAAGKPVISTAISDVINPYADLDLVHIINNADELIMAAELELGYRDKTKWLGKVDHYLSGISWDQTYQNMKSVINKTMEKNKLANQLNN